jgi:hypothetical protein
VPTLSALAIAPFGAPGTGGAHGVVLEADDVPSVPLAEPGLDPTASLGVGPPRNWPFGRFDKNGSWSHNTSAA